MLVILSLQEYSPSGLNALLQYSILSQGLTISHQTKVPHFLSAIFSIDSIVLSGA
jgi:hypothetical protein